MEYFRIKVATVDVAVDDGDGLFLLCARFRPSARADNVDGDGDAVQFVVTAFGEQVEKGFQPLYLASPSGVKRTGDENVHGASSIRKYTRNRLNNGNSLKDFRNVILKTVILH